MMRAWIDLKELKLRGLSTDLFHYLEGMDKALSFKIITKEDTRKHG
jgi:acyl-CoA thioester hydrolase